MKYPPTAKERPKQPNPNLIKQLKSIERCENIHL